jgi:hypothetical protein
MLRYDFKNASGVHCISAGFSINRKLGMHELVVQTYHFSHEQVKSSNFKLDAGNCLDCPFSFNMGNGSCYTHKGLINFGLKSMLKRLNKNKPKEFDQQEFDNFLRKVGKMKIDLIRFGAYGEPVLLGEPIIKSLLTLNYNKFTGYTHTWKRTDFQWAKDYFKASVHSVSELALARSLGWSSYLPLENPEKIGVLCPNYLAKVTCSDCGLCNAQFKPDIIAKLKYQ